MRFRLLGFAVILAAAAFPARGAVEVPGCADAVHAGGEWRSYGGSLENSRVQPLESTITPETAADLKPVKTFAASSVDATGGAFSNTPVIADGCLFLATDTGWVIARDADTLDAVWTRKLSGAAPGALVGGVIVGSPVVANGVVYVGVSRADTPYVAALDENTGLVKWFAVVDTWPSSFINSSPVYLDGMILQGIAGYEGGPNARGGYAIVDASADCGGDVFDSSEPPVKILSCTTPVAGATGGSIIEHHYLITDSEYFDQGYRGASIWCTPAVDPLTKYAYACGGNPASKKIEHRYANALLKIDMDPTRPTFGDLVDSYKGNVDQYYPGLDRQPLCEATGDDAVYLAWSLTCLQLDLDFGASPNLFTDDEGRTIIGALQKSGVYHAVFADQMSMAWTTVVGAPCFPCNASSTAADGTSIYAVGTPGGWMMSFTEHQGRTNWVVPTGGGTHFQPVTVAGGISYTINNAGILYGIDTATGLPAVVRSIPLDLQTITAQAGSAGIAVARNTVYAAFDEFVVAYRL